MTANLHTAQIGLHDGPNATLLMARAIRELARLLRSSPPVLVQCHAGVSLSPAIVAGYLTVYEKKALNEAFVFIDERRQIQLTSGLPDDNQNPAAWGGLVVVVRR